VFYILQDRIDQAGKDRPGRQGWTRQARIDQAGKDRPGRQG